MKYLFKEEFLQYVWRFLLFEKSNLKTDDGKSIEIVEVGTLNFLAGADFLNAKIKIDDTLWIGNVEVHIEAKNWYDHGHQNDGNYNNTILHVVYPKSSRDVQTESGREVPTLSIENLIYKNTLQKYLLLQKQDFSFISCQNLLKNIDDVFCHNYYESLLISRLQSKVKVLHKIIDFSNEDWDYAFMILLFSYFGAPVNKNSFAILARSISLKVMIKQSISVQNLESILFGQAGFLVEEDDYSLQLKKDYLYFKKLYNLPLSNQKIEWTFGGVRPPNFPTIRLAQLAALFSKKQRWFSLILEIEELSQLIDLFKVSPSEYWKAHYRFGKESKLKEKKMSISFIEKLMINVVIPFLFFYAQYSGEEKYQEKAIDWLQQIKPEKNGIIDQYRQLGFPTKSAFDTQALLTLKSDFCDKKKCLDCRIGYQILKK